ncbi:hypothetical protein CDL15_Pgr016326 [Punica granatum]|uniref:Uncharacterized protein n=1 Tax=Punica granatum TaxID=22663 RepID=A0A218W655_PUNGR|nr:hypothetical protein CDL15_Pgr016326 [Punica granatum]PKI44121.1 hypothetical protein CRG98_035465 [Punica granatum]
MDRIRKELRLVRCKKEGLREAFKLQYKEMEEHFNSITKNLDGKLDILEEKDKELGSVERRLEELRNVCTEKVKEKELSLMETQLEEFEAMLASPSSRMSSLSTEGDAAKEEAAATVRVRIRPKKKKRSEEEGERERDLG